MPRLPISVKDGTTPTSYDSTQSAFGDATTRAAPPPGMKWEEVEKTDKEGNVTGVKWVLVPIETAPAKTNPRDGIETRGGKQDI